jgi:ferredoxin
MDCFLEGPNFLIINPDECIDCSMCVPECPVGAIAGEHEIEPHQSHFIALNARLSKHPAWKPITASKAPPADHAEWAGVDSKLHLLQS